MLLVVGRIGRAHGVHGELAVEIRTDSPAERFTPGAVLFTDPAVAGPLIVAKARQHSGRLLVRFEGISDRSTASGLSGVSLLVDSDSLPRLSDPDEFHDHELIGLSAELSDGSRIGEVIDVLHGMGGDVLVIQRDSGKESLVPFVREIVPKVDLSARVVSIDPPEGLLDL